MDDDEDCKYVVKNLDTGETIDLEEASVKYNVLALAERSRYDF
jgi:hypothetical protein